MYQNKRILRRQVTVYFMTSEHLLRSLHRIVGISSSHAQKDIFLGSIDHNGHLWDLMTERFDL